MIVSELRAGTLQAPAWALPVFAVGIAAILAVAVPLLLKPGTDAFNEQRNDIGKHACSAAAQDSIARHNEMYDRIRTLVEDRATSSWVV